MKRQKRNSQIRALNKGYQAGAAGKPHTQCPHGSGESRHMWLSGWREGRGDHWDGYNTMAQVQKLANM